MLVNLLTRILILLSWLFVYFQLTYKWRFGILTLILINLYYQHRYKNDKKPIYKKAIILTLGMAIHLTLFGWVILIGRGYKVSDEIVQ